MLMTKKLIFINIFMCEFLMFIFYAKKICFHDLNSLFFYISMNEKYKQLGKNI